MFAFLREGRNQLGNGPIATFRFTIRPEARLGTATVTVEHAEAVAVDAKTKLTLADAAGLITIR